MLARTRKAHRTLDAVPPAPFCRAITRMYGRGGGGGRGGGRGRGGAGAYYKAKYGGGGRGGGRGGGGGRGADLDDLGGSSHREQAQQQHRAALAAHSADLAATLRRIDGKPYGAYRDILGAGDSRRRRLRARRRPRSVRSLRASEPRARDRPGRGRAVPRPSCAPRRRAASPSLTSSRAASTRSSRSAASTGGAATRAADGPPRRAASSAWTRPVRYVLTLVPIRPRRRGERRSLRTFPGASLRPSLAFNPRPRRLSTPPDAFQLHPDVRSYGTTLSTSSRARRCS